MMNKSTLGDDLLSVNKLWVKLTANTLRKVEDDLNTTSFSHWVKYPFLRGEESRGKDEY